MDDINSSLIHHRNSDTSPPARNSTVLVSCRVKICDASISPHSATSLTTLSPDRLDIFAHVKVDNP